MSSGRGEPDGVGKVKAARLFRRHLGHRAHGRTRACQHRWEIRGAAASFYDINRKRLAASRENSAFQPLAASCGPAAISMKE
jgi:hypothetical protein